MKAKAFTIIELLVTISVIMILTGIVLVSYQTGQKQLTLQRATSKLAQDIRRVQGMAMSAKECQPCGGVPAGGYGIYLHQGDDFYILYADGGNEQRDGNGISGDFDIETIYIEEGVYIVNLTPATASINFKPPDPTIRLVNHGGPPDPDNVIITIALKADTSKLKTIKVNKSGLIEVD